MGNITAGSYYPNCFFLNYGDSISMIQRTLCTLVEMMTILDDPKRLPQVIALPAATYVRYCNNSSKVVHQHYSTDAECGSDRDIETTVAVQEYRVRAI